MTPCAMQKKCGVWDLNVMEYPSCRNRTCFYPKQKKQKQGYFRASSMSGQMVGVQKILKEQMNANQPSPRKQVSVLFERKTEVFLSKSQSKVRGEMVIGERDAE